MVVDCKLPRGYELKSKYWTVHHKLPHNCELELNTVTDWQKLDNTVNYHVAVTGVEHWNTHAPTLCIVYRINCKLPHDHKLKSNCVPTNREYKLPHGSELAGVEH